MDREDPKGELVLEGGSEDRATTHRRFLGIVYRTNTTMYHYPTAEEDLTEDRRRETGWVSDRDPTPETLGAECDLATNYDRTIIPSASDHYPRPLTSRHRPCLIDQGNALTTWKVRSAERRVGTEMRWWT